MAKPYTPPESPEALKEAARLREVMQLEVRVNSAYRQRNNAAVALVRMALLLGWPAGRGLDNLTDNAPEWRHVVYLDLPNGEQVSYHMAPDDVPLLEGLPEYAGKWDGKFTGTTTWAGMVPTAPVENWCESGPDFDPDEIERLMQGVPVGELPLNPNWPKRAPCGLLRLEPTVPKAPFPPGVCACPKCEQPREVGKLFCAPHRSVESRFRNLEPLTIERLAYMMRRDGEQQ